MGGKVGPLQRTRSLLNSADAYRAGEQYTEAIAVLERALDEEGALDTALHAEAILRLADCHASLTHHEEACQVLLPLLDEAPDPIWEARALTRVARSLFYRHDLESTETLCREAIVVLGPTSHHDDVALAHQWLGNGLQAQGFVDDAAEAFRDAIAAAARSDDRGRRASCLGSMGCLEIARSRYPDAVRFLERSLEDSAALGHRIDVARANLHLSVCWAYLGDWDHAEKTAQEARQIYTRMGHASGQAVTLVALSRLARRREQPEEAERFLEEAARRASSAEFERLSAQVTLQRGDLAQDRGDLDEARRLYQEMLAKVESVAPGGDLVYSVMRRLASVASRSGQNVEARTLAEDALSAALVATNRREAARCRMVLAQIHWRGEATGQAGQLIDHAIREFQAIQTPWELSLAHEAAADIRRADAARERAHLTEVREIRGRLGLRTEDVARRMERDPHSGDGVSAADQIVATGAPMTKTVRAAKELWRFEGCILLFGETGTGKRLLARLIHDSGPNAGQPFVVVDCAALSARALEKELFGDGRDGCLRSVGEGTVVLQSVHALPMEIQPRFAAAIDARKYRPVGAPKDVTFQARVLATTHESLAGLAERECFLPGLVHRLSTFRLDVPPLRDRVLDIRPMCERLLRAQPGRGVIQLAPEVEEALVAYEWPGNGRELHNAIESAIFHARDENVLRLEHFPPPISDAALPPNGLPAQIGALERREIRSAMAQAAGNKKRAAELLGVSRKGLIDRLKRLGLWEEFGSARHRRRA